MFLLETIFMCAYDLTGESHRFGNISGRGFVFGNFATLLQAFDQNYAPEPTNDSVDNLMRNFGMMF